MVVRLEGGSRLREIGSDAFRECHQLMWIFEIPASVEIIGARCFYECRFLSRVEFERGSVLRILGDEAFYACGITRILIPASVEVIGVRCFAVCGLLFDVSVENGSWPRKMSFDAFSDCPELGPTEETPEMHARPQMLLGGYTPVVAGE
jgi:hypothetical protein